MPVEGCLNAPGLTVVVTMTCSPHTIGDDQPRPGTAAFHATFFVADHVTGRPSLAATPRPIAPRNCGHTASAGTDGSGAPLAAIKNTIAVTSMRISVQSTRGVLFDCGIQVQ